MSEILQDPMFFYAVTFFIFIALAFIYGRKPILGWLDGEIAQIRSELDSARQLRAEAEAALADCKEKQARAEADAKAILANAKYQAEEMQKQAEHDLTESLKRHQTLAAERIALVEAEAVAEVRAIVIRVATAAAHKALTENMAEADAARLVDQAIADIPALKAAKAQAA